MRWPRQASLGVSFTAFSALRRRFTFRPSRIMTSPLPPFVFDEFAPSSARRVWYPEDIACAIIYASVILLLISRVVLQLLE